MNLILDMKYRWDITDETISQTILDTAEKDIEAIVSRENQEVPNNINHLRKITSSIFAINP